MFAAIELRRGAWRRVRQGSDPKSCEGPRLALANPNTRAPRFPNTIDDLGTIDILRYQSEARMLAPSMAPSRFQHEVEEGAVIGQIS
jgi:hypothetical protein